MAACPGTARFGFLGLGGLGFVFPGLLLKKLPSRDVLVDWTLGSVNSAIYFSRPSPREDLTPSSSWGWDSLCQVRGCGRQRIAWGLPRGCAPGQGVLGSRLCLFFCFMQFEQKPERARSPVLLCGLELLSSPSGRAF